MNIELKPCPFCGGEAEMMGDQYPYVECQECGAGFTANHSYEFDEGDAASKWNARSTAGPNLKPIAESKVRQLGGDVCGVLVRTDGGVTAVSEHGRCTRLNAGVMGPVDGAQGGEWLIQMRGEYLKTRGVWERPDHRGYTNDINEAGRYSEDEAKEAERMMPEKCKAVRLPTARAQGGVEPDEKGVERVARAFWRRIYPYRNEYGKELPEECPVEFLAHMSTALCALYLIGCTVKPVGYTNYAQLQYVEEGDEAMFYPDTDQGCNIPLYTHPPSAGVPEVVSYICHNCGNEAPPPAPYKMYVKCPCGATTAATIAADLAKQVQRQPAVPEAWRVAVQRVVDELSIMDESEGIAGFHLNGDVSPWDEGELPSVRDELQDLLSTAPQADGWVLMPEELTAENGAKSLLMSEFHEVVELECGACDADNEDCGGCGGNGSYTYRVPVSWPTIKSIYRLAVEKLKRPQPPAGQEGSSHD